MVESWPNLWRDERAQGASPEVERHPARKERDARANTTQGRGELVLLVEDEMAILRVAERTLTRYGYRVLLARDGAEALAVAAQHPGEIALVITDIMMPQLDGMATIRALRGANPRQRFLAIRGFLSEQLPWGPPEVPWVPFLQKPFTVQQLVWAVQEAIQATGHLDWTGS